MLGKIVNGYTLTAFKGSGSFGSVYVCQKNNSTYAMKIFNLAYVFNEFLKGEDNRITREIAALKSVNHPNVVSYMQFEDTTTAEVKFKQYLYHIFCTGIHENSLLLLSQKNKRCAPSVSFYIDGSVYNLSAVCNPATDCSGIVPQHLKQSIEVDEIFPQCAACCKLNDTFKEKISKCCQMGDEKKAIYITFGTEVAHRNIRKETANYVRENCTAE